MLHLDYASSLETQESATLTLTALLRLVALLFTRVSPAQGCRAAGVQHPLESRAHVAPTSRLPLINLRSPRAYLLPFFIPHPSFLPFPHTSENFQMWGNVGEHAADRNPSCLVPLRARCRHNVIIQNRPFSRLRAAFLSVAALKRDDTTFSMSLNVIIFIVKLRC
jgi:hypothetical protein